MLRAIIFLRIMNKLIFDVIPKYQSDDATKWRYFVKPHGYDQQLFARIIRIVLTNFF